LDLVAIFCGAICLRNRQFAHIVYIPLYSYNVPQILRFVIFFLTLLQNPNIILWGEIVNHNYKPKEPPNLAFL